MNGIAGWLPPRRLSHPGWVPHDGTSVAVPAGIWWDAVRVEQDTGRRALEILRQLRQRPGPVIAAPQGAEPRLYFLVPPGVADVSGLPHTHLLGSKSYVVVPGTSRMDPPGPHWVVAPDVDHRLTNHRALREALVLSAGGCGVMAGGKWLASAATVPEQALAAWNSDNMACIPVGSHWRVVRVAKTIGLEALARLSASGQELGPVLLTVHAQAVEFLVPSDLTYRWTLPGTNTAVEPDALYCPHPAVVLPRSLQGCTWLIPPDGSGTLTDASLLHEAFATALS